MTNRNIYTHSKCALAVTLALSASTGAFAEEAKEADIEKIVVTSTKRAQTLTEIPYNVSAVNGETMRNSGIDDMAKLSRVVPGLTFPDKGPRSAGTFVGNTNMRGMNIDGNGLSSEGPASTAPTVATYVGNVPLFVGLRLKDIEQVEVLRGPQSTLYGSGAMGGIIRVVQKSPQLDENTVFLETTMSTTKNGGFNYELDTTFNKSLGDTAALRVNLGKVDNKGFIDYTNLYVLDDNNGPVFDAANGETDMGSRTSKKGVNYEDIQNARVALYWEPTASFNAELTYHKQKDDVGGRQADSSLQEKYDDYELAASILEPFEREVDLLSLDMEVDMGFATFTSATSKANVKGSVTTDSTGEYVTVVQDSLGFDCTEWCSITGEPTTLWQYYYGNNPRMLFNSTRAFEDEAFTQEFRLVSNDSNMFDWLIGAYYQDQTTAYIQTDYNYGREGYRLNGGMDKFALPNWSDPTEFPDRELAYFFDNNMNFKDLSFFGELTYNVSDDFQVTGGVRYYNQEVNSTQYGGLVFGAALDSNTGDIDDSGTLFKLNSSYNLAENMMVFATYSEGFRRGGTNALPKEVFGEVTPDEFFSYEADKVENMEIGLKGQLENGTNYTATIFALDWTNPQVNTLMTGLAFVGVAGGGKAENKGVEIELNGMLTDDITYGFGYSYIKAEIVEGDKNGIVAATGDRLPGVPEHSASLNLNYLTEHGDWEATYNAGISYQSSVVTTTQPPNNGSILSQFNTHGSFVTADMAAIYQKDAWRLRAFVNNITNEKATVGGLTLAGGGTSGQNETMTRPRTIGLSVSYFYE